MKRLLLISLIMSSAPLLYSAAENLSIETLQREYDEAKKEGSKTAAAFSALVQKARANNVSINPNDPETREIVRRRNSAQNREAQLREQLEKAIRIFYD